MYSIISPTCFMQIVHKNPHILWLIVDTPSFPKFRSAWLSKGAGNASARRRNTGICSRGAPNTRSHSPRGGVPIGKISQAYQIIFSKFKKTNWKRWCTVDPKGMELQTVSLWKPSALTLWSIARWERPHFNSNMFHTCHLQRCDSTLPEKKKNKRQPTVGKKQLQNIS